MTNQFNSRAPIFTFLFWSLATNVNAEPVESFVKKFVRSCTSQTAEEKAFYISRIHIPLAYSFTVVDEGGAHSSPEVLRNFETNPNTGGFVLPICIGDGGLEETSVKRKKDVLSVELTYGSGPNEKLRFKQMNGEWKLIYAEWIDH
jgi:hypothetical protein